MALPRLVFLDAKEVDVERQALEVCRCSSRNCLRQVEGRASARCLRSTSARPPTFPVCMACSSTRSINTASRCRVDCGRGVHWALAHRVFDRGRFPKAQVVQGFASSWPSNTKHVFDFFIAMPAADCAHGSGLRQRPSQGCRRGQHSCRQHSRLDECARLMTDSFSFAGQQHTGRRRWRTRRWR